MLRFIPTLKFADHALPPFKIKSRTDCVLAVFWFFSFCFGCGLCFIRLAIFISHLNVEDTPYFQTAIALNETVIFKSILLKYIFTVCRYYGNVIVRGCDVICINLGLNKSRCLRYFFIYLFFFFWGGGGCGSWSVYKFDCRRVKRTYPTQTLN